PHTAKLVSGITTDDHDPAEILSEIWRCAIDCLMPGVELFGAGPIVFRPKHGERLASTRLLINAALMSPQFANRLPRGHGCTVPYRTAACERGFRPIVGGPPRAARVPARVLERRPHIQTASSLPARADRWRTASCQPFARHSCRRRK